MAKLKDRLKKYWSAISQWEFEEYLKSNPKGLRITLDYPTLEFIIKEEKKLSWDSWTEWLDVWMEAHQKQNKDFSTNDLLKFIKEKEAEDDS